MRDSSFKLVYGIASLESIGLGFTVDGIVRGCKSPHPVPKLCLFGLDFEWAYGPG